MKKNDVELHPHMVVSVGNHPKSTRFF